jgi:hypothetical protein
MMSGPKHLFLFVCAAAVSFAQSTFVTITGTVQDPAGAGVPGASVEATQVQTNFKYTATTGETGDYTIANANAGTYRVRIRANGFQEYRVDDIVLAPRDVRRVDAVLRIGAVDTVIEVSGGATLIETETQRISDVRTREELRALPLTLRRAWDYFTLSPQVSKTTAGFQVRFAGSRQNQGEAVIDGTSIARSGGGFASGPLMDRTEAYQELRIDIAGANAEFGTMGQVTLTSRAGTNDFHGTFSDYYTTPAFIARNPFFSQRTGSVGHRITLGAGGPVYFPKIYNGKNKTFWFTTLEFGTGSGGITTISQSVPTVSWRRGDFSRLLPGTVIRDPFASNAPFAGNVIPASRINATARAIQDRFYAMPNFGDPETFAAQNYRETRQNQIAHQPNFTLRLDHRFSDKNFIYGRITTVDWNLNNFEGNPMIKERFTRSRTLRASTIAHTYSFNSSMLNEARWGISFDDLPAEPPISGRQLVSELGLRGLVDNLPDRGGIHQVGFTGIGISALNVSNVSCSPCGWDQIQQFTDNFTWFRGRHNLKFGTAWQWGRARDRREGALFGNTNYTNRYTNHPYADFLLGIPTTMQRDFPAVESDRRAKTYAFYVQDEWKALPTLTVSMGLRWQVMPGWTEANGRQAIFDIGTGNIVVPDGSLNLVSPLMPTGYVRVTEASQAGRDARKLVKTDWNNVAPRFGLAWRPLGNNTVFRGGFGIYYDAAARSPAAAGVPFILNEPAYTNELTNPLMLPVVYPSTPGRGPATVTLPIGMRPDLRIPFSMQYQFTVEHQRWDTGFRLSYTGTNTRQGVYRYDINQPVADERLYINKPRRFPNYPGINYEVNGAGHQYHGASVEVQRRMKGGVQFQAYYTLQRDIGDLENGEVPEDAYDRRRERAAWGALPTHRFTGLMIFELPFGRGKPLFNTDSKVANFILSGWKVSPIYIYETGNFITPLWTGPDPTGTRFTNNASRPNVTLRPDALRDSRLADRSIYRWFDVSAFAAPPVGRFGTSAKYVIKGVPVNVLHGSLAKEWKVKERAVIRWEFLGNNLLNHPNYMEPGTNISQAGTAGVITAVMDRNAKFDSAIIRVLQAQLRVEW